MELALKSKTVKQLREYCKTHNIRGYSRLRKNDLIDFLIDQMKRKEFITAFNFENDYFSKPLVKCEFYGEYYKPSYKNNHFRSLKHRIALLNEENIEEKYLRSKTKRELLDYYKRHNFKVLENLNKPDLIIYIIDPVQKKQVWNLLPFDNDLFTKPRKPRRSQIKRKICGEYYKKSYKSQHLRSPKHRNANLLGSEEVIEIDSSFKSRLKTYWVINIHNVTNLTEFLYDRRKRIVKDLIKEILNTNKHLKVNLKLFCDYEREGSEIQEHTFKTRNSIIVKYTDLDEFYDNTVEKILAEVDDFEGRGSGWSLDKIKQLELAINKYDPLKGASYMDLPEELKKKQL
ncbi:hypothetical protein AVEN_202551-1 [Araneus ventricosus]|uniref:Rho termination factor-like N-terminal domain-containing protein n=1 Tax=Araneus ventricosus TaxID=182803 RepID=A0A4Y2IQA0_ARAVE|nr:hypothetical protein AVEN_202551-1 [Araneus ventricosus]